MSFQCHLADIVSTKNSSDILIFLSLCLFLLVVWKKSPLFLDLSNLVITLYIILFLLFDFVEILESLVYRFHQVWKNFDHYFFIFLSPSLFHNFWDPRQMFSHTLLIFWLFPQTLFFSVYLILKGFCCYVFINIH